MFGLICLGTGLAQAGHLTCGDILVANTTLDTNLSCAGTSGVIIGADGITVDLNGFTITGTTAAFAFGVDNTGGFNNVTIRDGAISGFEQGIRAEGARNFRIRRLTLSGQTSSHAIDILDSDQVRIENVSISLDTTATAIGDPEGIRLESVDQVIVHSVHVDGGFIGVNFACGTCDGTELPTNGRVEDSTFTNNGFGVLIANSTDARITSNRISGASSFCDFCGNIDIGAGIRLSDFLVVTGSRISKNVVIGSAVGIKVAPSNDIRIWDNDVNANTAEGILLSDTDDSRIERNRVHLNGGDGISLTSGSTGNRIRRNQATGNGGTDIFHDVTSTPNTWVGNTCVTSEDGATNDIDCP